MADEPKRWPFQFGLSSIFWLTAIVAFLCLGPLPTPIRKLISLAGVISGAYVLGRVSREQRTKPQATHSQEANRPDAADEGRALGE